jgi:hypothetical protein
MNNRIVKQASFVIVTILFIATTLSSCSKRNTCPTFKSQANTFIEHNC